MTSLIAASEGGTGLQLDTQLVLEMPGLY